MLRLVERLTVVGLLCVGEVGAADVPETDTAASLAQQHAVASGKPVVIAVTPALLRDGGRAQASGAAEGAEGPSKALTREYIDENGFLVYRSNRPLTAARTPVPKDHGAFILYALLDLLARHMPQLLTGAPVFLDQMAAPERERAMGAFSQASGQPATWLQDQINEHDRAGFGMRLSSRVTLTKSGIPEIDGLGHEVYGPIYLRVQETPVFRTAEAQIKVPPREGVEISREGPDLVYMLEGSEVYRIPGFFDKDRSGAHKTPEAGRP